METTERERRPQLTSTLTVEPISWQDANQHLADADAERQAWDLLVARAIERHREALERLAGR